ncbi:hypothetical protein GCM10009624_29440 [Gordonia sinesedis]
MARTSFQLFDSPTGLAAFVVEQSIIRHFDIVDRYAESSRSMDIEDLRRTITNESPRSVVIELVPQPGAASESFGRGTIVIGAVSSGVLIESRYGAEWDGNDSAARRYWIGIRQDLRKRCFSGGWGLNADGQQFETKLFYTQSALDLHQDGVSWRQLPGGISFSPSGS